MANFDSGVSAYVTAKYTVYVHFPVDMRGNADIACKYCPYYRKSYNLCELNGEIVAYGEKFVGDNCPLERVERE